MTATTEKCREQGLNRKGKNKNLLMLFLNESDFTQQSMEEFFKNYILSKWKGLPQNKDSA